MVAALAKVANFSGISLTISEYVSSVVESDVYNGQNSFIALLVA
jgi:hypothetical protein